jgi:hypothetical protein
METGGGDSKAAPAMEPGPQQECCGLGAPREAAGDLYLALCPGGLEDESMEVTRSEETDCEDLLPVGGHGLAAQVVL